MGYGHFYFALNTYSCVLCVGSKLARASSLKLDKFGHWVLLSMPHGLMFHTIALKVSAWVTSGALLSTHPSEFSIFWDGSHTPIITSVGLRTQDFLPLLPWCPLLSLNFLPKSVKLQHLIWFTSWFSVLLSLEFLSWEVPWPQFFSTVVSQNDWKTHLSCLDLTLVPHSVSSCQQCACTDIIVMFKTELLPDILRMFSSDSSEKAWSVGQNKWTWWSIIF